MSDVVLNLIYNDNNAQKNVDNLIRSLQQIENHSYHININSPELQQMVNKIKEVTTEVQKLQNLRNISIGSGVRTSFNELESVLKNFESRLASAQQRVQELKYEMQGRIAAGLEVDKEAFNQQIENAIDRVVWLKNAIEDVKSDMSKADSKNGISDGIERANEAEKNLIKYQRESIELTDQQIEKQRKFEEANKEIAVGNRQTWRGIYQVITGTIHSLTAIYNTWKSAVTAPLNLTGVSQVASMITSMEGSLLLNQISSNITTGFTNSVERFDILQTFPAVMEAIGFSADQSMEAMDRLYQSVLGLPTAFEDVVSVAQYFALVLGDLDKATDLAIAANNAFVASGATSQQITSGMRQLQYLIDGTKLRSTQWYSLIRAMPVALREVGVALGYPNFNAFTADLMSGKVATDDLIDSLIEVGLHSEKISGVVDIMKTRVQAALDNVRNAAKRMGNTMLEALDETLKRTGGKGIAENIKGVSGILDRIAQVSAEWISNNGDKIQALIDKFMSINWEDIIPKLFNGLAEFADKALDNINDMLDKIPALLTTTSQWINDFENSAFFKWISGGGSIISGGAQIGLGISNLALGMKTRTAANTILAELGMGGSTSIFGSVGTSLSGIGGVAGATAIGSAIALAITNIVDLIYQLADKGWENGRTEYLNHWKWMNPAAYGYIALRDSLLFSDSDNKQFLDSTLGWIKNQLEVVDENGLITQYSLRHLNADKIQALRDRYGSYSFANEDWLNVLDLLKTGLLVLPTGQYDSDMNTLNYDISRLTSSMNLADEIVKPYDAAIDALEAKKEDILKEIEAINEEIGKEFAGVDVNIFTFYKSIYDKNKKFFSEQFEEASGWGYANTTKDRAEFLEKNLPQITGIIDDITQYALDNYSDDEAVLAVVAQFMADFNWNDPEQLAVLVKNYGGKSMQEVFEQYFEQQAKNLNLDEAIRTALLNSQLQFKENELEGIDIEQKHLEEERESALAPVIEMIEDDMEILQDDFANVIYGTERSAKQVVNVMENIFNTLSSKKPEKDINDFFSNIYNTIKKWIRLIPVAMSSVKLSAYNDNLLGQGYYSANGGLTPRGTDTIPAMLTPGEYVQRRAAVEHFGRMFMDRINALDLNGALRSLQITTPYSNGGFIRNETRNYRDNHATVNQTFNNSSANFGFRRANRFVRALG